MNIEEKRNLQLPSDNNTQAGAVQPSVRTLVTQDSDVEMFPVVDEAGEVIGKMSRAEAHDGSKKLHPVVHLHVFNSKGELYLQQRAEWKSIQPGKWDTATGGHVDYGETIWDSLAREVYEEIGLAPDSYKPRFLKKYVYESMVEKELVYIFTTVYDGTPSPSKTETQGGRFWAKEDIKANIGMKQFTPMFEKEYLML